MVLIYGGSRTGIGSGYDNTAVVDYGGALRVYDPSGASPTVQTSSGVYVIAGSTIILGSVSTYGSAGGYAGSDAYVSAGSIIILGSVNTYGGAGGYAGSDVYIRAGSVQTYNQVGIGSIWFGGGIGSFTITNTLADIGSFTTQTISGIITIDNRVAGSIVNLPIGSISLLNSLGSTEVFGNLTTTAGSESYIKGGSIQPYNPIGIGSVTIVSARYDLGSYLLIAGSISSMPSISVATGSEVYVKGGSIFLYSGTTNYVNVPNIVAVSGTLFAVSGIVNQGTTPWVISGTANISGVFIGISGVVNPSPGSSYILSSPGSIGIFGRVEVFNQGVDLNVTQISDQRGIYAGSIRLLSTPGSIGVYDADANGFVVDYPSVSQDYSGVTFITTGSKLIWYPLAGSKAQLKAFSVSTDVPQKVSLYFSGTVAPTNRGIWSARLPASGTTAMNLIGIVCSGVIDQAIGAVINVAGSVDITIFARSLA